MKKISGIQIFRITEELFREMVAKIIGLKKESGEDENSTIIKELK
ncbi:MAG TPA: hypothetical protein PKK13_09540 [Spirochaetota bacterium]|nr:hypothetical protein [Spirochaetota bacterium]